MSTMRHSLSSRRRHDELMDQPGLDAGEHIQALQALERVNRVSRSGSHLWREIERLSKKRNGSPLRVLDIACGGGDIAIDLAKRARHARLNIQIDGCDLSPQAVAYAQEQANAAGLNSEFFTLDILADPIPSDYDILTSTLFLHHLDEADALTFLQKMRDAAGRMVLVDDLIRSRLGYLLAVIGCHVLSRSPIVHFDGPVSVQGAFTVSEMRQMANAAGLNGAIFTTHWPQRFLMSWSRPE
jgi:2-polyprenyl-3-methyl-5-hydroxy-6-metoxy-1,4-benzoquinol methylase